MEEEKNFAELVDESMNIPDQGRIFTGIVVRVDKEDVFIDFCSSIAGSWGNMYAVHVYSGIQKLCVYILTNFGVQSTNGVNVMKGLILLKSINYH